MLVILHRWVRVGLTEEMTSKQRFKGGEGGRQVNIHGECITDRSVSQCRGLAWACDWWAQGTAEARVAGVSCGALSSSAGLWLKLLSQMGAPGGF